jgi:Transposase IS116/IS110/IS902 family
MPHGIAHSTANPGTSFLAELGKIDNYETHKHLIAYADIDPTVYQSGKYRGRARYRSEATSIFDMWSGS